MTVAKEMRGTVDLSVAPLHDREFTIEAEIEKKNEKDSTEHERIPAAAETSSTMARSHEASQVREGNAATARVTASTVHDKNDVDVIAEALMTVVEQKRPKSRKRNLNRQACILGPRRVRSRKTEQKRSAIKVSTKA